MARLRIIRQTDPDEAAVREGRAPSELKSRIMREVEELLREHDEGSNS